MLCGRQVIATACTPTPAQDHLAGKQYQGWRAIRDKLVELQEKYAAKAAEEGEINAPEEAALRGQPSMDQGRSRERSSRSRERSSRSRERSRERDGYRPRSRCVCVCG